ncbi:MAG: hypothetical protein FWF69_08070 [Firmicutes bacterium]|nr:hypothetical protein [Bacillota bacterium]
MAVTNIKSYSFVWMPEPARLAKKLRVAEADRGAFEDMLMRAKAAYKPKAWVRTLSLEALGDDFAMLSGAWFEGAPLAAVLSLARRVWAYVVTAAAEPINSKDAREARWLASLGEEAVRGALERICADLSTDAEEAVFAISPGASEAWPASQREPLLHLFANVETGATPTGNRLLTPRDGALGFLIAQNRTPCGHDAGGCGRCGSCDGPAGRAKCRSACLMPFCGRCNGKLAGNTV